MSRCTDSRPLRKAYLTVDDSPSAHTDALVDALSARNIPALLFCRGDQLVENSAPIVRALQKGFVVGNHAYAHQRFSDLSFDACVEEIQKTERLIEATYWTAGVARTGKYFRFPHMDRGCGGWVVNYDAYPDYKDDLLSVFATGLNARLTPPSPADIAKKNKLQEFLHAEGFTSPYAGVTFPWYANTECATAIDAMFTYSTADWMLTARHRGKWPYKTLADLTAKIDADPFLARPDSTHIILAHDQAELLDVVIPLLDHFQAREFVFAPI